MDEVRGFPLNERVWGLLFSGYRGMDDPAPDGAGQGNDDESVATLGLIWADPHVRIRYDIRVNGVDLPPSTARGGRLLRRIVVRRGANRFDWAVRQHGPPSRNAVYLKVGNTVTKLGEGRTVSKDATWRAEAVEVKVR